MRARARRELEVVVRVEEHGDRAAPDGERPAALDVDAVDGALVAHDERLEAAEEDMVDIPRGEKIMDRDGGRTELFEREGSRVSRERGRRRTGGRGGHG